MQYILIEREKVKDKAYHETMPDGRVILPFSAVKMGGVMEGVTIVPSGTVLKAMILEQKAAGVKPPQEEFPEDVGGIVSEGGETNADGENDEYVDFEPVGDEGTENGDGTEAGEEPSESEEVQGEEPENGSGDGEKVSEDSETNQAGTDEPDTGEGEKVSENGETNQGDVEEVSEGEETIPVGEEVTENDNVMEDIDL